VSSHLATIKAIQGKAEDKYLLYFLSTIESQNLVQDSNYPSLKTSAIEKIEFSIPPLATQQKIVAKLDAIFDEIDKALLATEANVKNVEALLRNILTHEFNVNKGEWESRDLCDLAHQECTLSYGIVQPGDDYSNGLPIVRPTDLTSKYVYQSHLKRINPELAASYKRTTLTGNELLLCVRGTTGTTSISTSELKGCNVTRGIVPIRFKDDLIDLNYAYYFFKSDILQKQIKEKTYGAALLQINISDLRKLKIDFPNFHEQLKIVKRLDVLSNSIGSTKTTYLNKLKNLDDLKKSTLKQAFNGELVKD
jgi:type I restriction enzyme S subunit